MLLYKLFRVPIGNVGGVYKKDFVHDMQGLFAIINIHEK